VDGEAELFEDLHGATLSALEVTGGEAPASDQFVRPATSRSRLRARTGRDAATEPLVST